MSRIIQPDQVKVGDKIRIDRVIEGTVSEPGRLGNGPGYIRLDGISRRISDGNGMVNTITLLERPFDLPTRPGAVVKVDSESHWFLSASRPFGDMRWTSATGNMFTPDEFREFIIKYRFDIEVIA